MDVDRDWIRARARELRRSMPDAEVILWDRLRKRRLAGYRFHRQHAVGRAILDFYCPERRLAVEVDGDTHDPHQDARRDARLAVGGIDVVRVSNDDVYCHLYDVLEDIAECLEARPSWPGDPADR
ncbi:MAG: endonuclease domain-containing protein [Acidimicrobiia bacterium]